MLCVKCLTNEFSHWIDFTDTHAHTKTRLYSVNIIISSETEIFQFHKNTFLNLVKYTLVYIILHKISRMFSCFPPNTQIFSMSTMNIHSSYE